jgi:hypothetical protein
MDISAYFAAAIGPFSMSSAPSTISKSISPIGFKTNEISVAQLGQPNKESTENADSFHVFFIQRMKGKLIPQFSK